MLGSTLRQKRDTETRVGLKTDGQAVVTRRRTTGACDDVVGPVGHGRLVDANNDIRAAMARALPRFLQPFLTWLTAKPTDGEPVRRRRPIYHVVFAYLSVVLGVALSVYALWVGGWLLIALPCALILTTSGLGKLQAVIYHHCAHWTVFQRRAWNDWMGAFISILLAIKRFKTYRAEHLRHHHIRVQLTDEDEFMQFLEERLGMRRGMPKRVLKRRMLAGLFSPRFHWQFLIGRLKSCFLTADSLQNVLAAVFWAALLALVSYFGVWWEFAVVWLVPVIVLFQAATTLRILCEHRFPSGELLRSRGPEFVCEVTAGVFPGCSPPENRRGVDWLWSWSVWWGQMLTVHLFSRLFVLVGDASAHDYHHRNPNSSSWATHIYERHRDVRAGSPRFRKNYVEYWGLFGAIDDILDTVSRAPAKSPLNAS